MRSIITRKSPRKQNQRHPFSLPFSPRRMTQPGFERRVPPTVKQAEKRGVS
jgi:hypothetical protein